ncbi:phosphatidylethanolamine-binding protein [Zychaea mexicana]|uniref:phosphatidylethanolamine-binding protein n=1 Tax=Zychaea mexicana TaxID=64656 RepID=UPI0022FE7844|nr:phosphatidylethanolamine-binding protein [Zychaea mexicana]KAI9490323.1 phosphatidylethanolamine-binding protein [Zychaea mexicana]
MPLLTSEMNMGMALKKAKITPHLVAESFLPTTMMEIKYANDQDVALGNELSLQDTANPPDIFFLPADESGFYTLMLIDPDAPSAQDNSSSPFRHWIVTNVPGSSSQINGTTAQQLSSYYKPAPPAGTGPHRYIFLLYKQEQGEFKDDAVQVAESRAQFDFQQFAREHQLSLVGVNFFKASSHN